MELRIVGLEIYVQCLQREDPRCSQEPNSQPCMSTAYSVAVFSTLYDYIL